MGRQLDLSFVGARGIWHMAIGTANRHAGHALPVIVVVVLVVVGPPPPREAAAGQVAVKDALVDIAGVNGGSRVGDEVVAHMRECALHGAGGG